VNRLRVYRVRQGEAAAERSVGALDAKVIVFGYVFLELALAADGEQIVLDVDVDVFFITSGRSAFSTSSFGLSKMSTAGPRL